MKRRILLVPLVALLIEAVNFRLFAPALDIGSEPGAAWYVRVLDLQWTTPHLLGLSMLDTAERTLGCRSGNARGSCSRIDVAVLFTSGLLETICLLGVVIVVARLVRPRRRNPQ